jgi:uncharacterized protein (TIGR03435 family)
MRMRSIFICLAFCAAASGQTAPKFEIADVHVSAKTPNRASPVMPVHNGRYEIHNAPMVNLIASAYGFEANQVLGGPNWLEMDRFDVIAKVPDKTSADDLTEMLQSLLAERFKLVVHKDSQPMPAYALTAGKKLQMKEADGAGDTGCRVQDAPAGDGVVRLTMMNGNGTTTTMALEPGGIVHYSCRNMTMTAFAEGLRGMMGVNLGNNPVLDKTDIAGRWNFDVKWATQINGPATANAVERISVADALEKQLGLKLEQEQVPTPVLVVDSVNESPTANLPEVARALPVIPSPTAFEVAEVKPTDPDYKGGSMQTQPGGRFTARGNTMQILLMRALNPAGGIAALNFDSVAGVPKWAETDRFDIVAKAPADAPSPDPSAVSVMLRSLLEERFGLKAHTEERPVSAYALVAAKSGSPQRLMKKADPASRTHCSRSNGAAGSPPGTQVMTCQNITMAQFADQLLYMGTGNSWPVLDSTGLAGGWDFTMTYAGRSIAATFAGAPPAGDAPAAADPSGGFTLFEAIERQLGLKLEIQKRPMPVTVIDQLEERPTDN